MSDYMFMLESHLSTDQFRVVGQMQAVAAAAGRQPVPHRRRDARHAGRLSGARPGFYGGRQRAEAGQNRWRRSTARRLSRPTSCASAWSCVFPGGVRGGTGHGAAGEIREIRRATADHRGDHSRGPALPRFHGQCDRAVAEQSLAGPAHRSHQRRRAISSARNCAPFTTIRFTTTRSRMLRLIRFKVRLGYAIDERTRMQYENAREAEMLTKITPEALGSELRHMAEEPLSADLMRTLEEEKLIGAVFAGADRGEAESGELHEAPESPPDGALRRGFEDPQPAAVPQRADGKPEREGSRGADQERGARTEAK